MGGLGSRRLGPSNLGIKRVPFFVLGNLIGNLVLPKGSTGRPRLSNREFPKIGDPNIVPTLNSRILIIRTPKIRYPHFRKLP